MNTLSKTIAGLLLVAMAAASGAATTLSGSLGDSGNGALVGSDLGLPDFTDDNAIANNVALYTFTVTQDGLVSVVSTGFAAGGVDPYFTLFTGTGTSATLLDSNYFQAFSTGGDFSWSGMLVAGDYEIALGSFANMSCAENGCGSVLGDGFTMLGDPNSLFTGSYALTLSTPVTEPSTTWLLLAGVAGLATRVRRARRNA
jgi:hypothetical protein